MWFIYWDACGLICWLFGLVTVSLVNYVTVAFVVDPWMGALSARGLALLLPFELLILLIYTAYVRAATTDPGSVTRNTAQASDAAVPSNDPDFLWKPPRRFCSKCSAIKPPRAHHCSTCNRCINRMDE